MLSDAEHRTGRCGERHGGWSRLEPTQGSMRDHILDMEGGLQALLHRWCNANSMDDQRSSTPWCAPRAWRSMPDQAEACRKGDAGRLVRKLLVMGVLLEDTFRQDNEYGNVASRILVSHPEAAAVRRAPSPVCHCIVELECPGAWLLLCHADVPIQSPRVYGAAAPALRHRADWRCAQERLPGGAARLPCQEGRGQAGQARQGCSGSRGRLGRPRGGGHRGQRRRRRG